MSNAKWHALSVADVCRKFQTGLQKGLGLEDILRRRKIYGLNDITTYKKDSILKRFLRQFHNALIYILIASVFITIYFAKYVDASVIIGVILINAIFGFLQEGKAEKALDAIRNMLSPTAEVIRGGKREVIPASELVPGDVVIIKRGDKVPADIRLCETKNLQVQEAILTGESLPIEKSILEVAEDLPIGDRYSMLYSGTLITDGRGIGVVVATGSNTEVGKISEALVQVESIDTPLLRQMNSFGRWLTLLIILIAFGVFLVGALVWHDLGPEMFMGIVGLTVAAVPEGLPPIMTIILSIGVTQMAKHKAIVRRLPAVESMGSVTTICTDKTGTLTSNELAVQSLVTSRNYYLLDGALSFDNPDLEKAIASVVLCNDADISHRDKSHELYGNPIDMAFNQMFDCARGIDPGLAQGGRGATLPPWQSPHCLVTRQAARNRFKLGLKSKFDAELLRQKFPRNDLIPYETEHKFMATLHHDHDGNGFIYIKGAPEIILERCRAQQVDGVIAPLDKDYWNKHIEQLASKGERLIAVAYKPTDSSQSTLHFDDVNDGLVLVAIFGLIDPPRKEAILSVKECQRAGINVKMITGDHASTAKAIALQVGIDASEVLTGNMIDNMSDDDLAKIAPQVNVYARTTPSHKLRLVKALQSRGEIVAMTGDGINDAPALKQADIGVAMGEKGADLAKESSEMVLADDNFATIVEAVREGRTIYDNLKKAILFILPVSFAQAIAVVIAILFGLVLPITAVQILWVNMITAVTLCLAFGFEPPDLGVMERPPRNPQDSLLSWHLLWRVVSVSLIFAATIFGMFLFVHQGAMNLDIARTVAVNVLVVGEVMYLINCRNLKSSSINLSSFFGSIPILLSILAIMILQIIFTYVPFMQHFFNTASIGLNYWGYISAAGIVTFGLVEVEKIFLAKSDA